MYTESVNASSHTKIWGGMDLSRGIGHIHTGSIDNMDAAYFAGPVAVAALTLTTRTMFR